MVVKTNYGHPARHTGETARRFLRIFAIRQHMNEIIRALSRSRWAGQGR
jgi:hypothetical protein